MDVDLEIGDAGALTHDLDAARGREILDALRRRQVAMEDPLLSAVERDERPDQTRREDRVGPRRAARRQAGPSGARKNTLMKWPMSPWPLRPIPRSART